MFTCLCVCARDCKFGFCSKQSLVTVCRSVYTPLHMKTKEANFILSLAFPKACVTHLNTKSDLCSLLALSSVSSRLHVITMSRVFSRYVREVPAGFQTPYSDTKIQTRCRELLMLIRLSWLSLDTLDKSRYEAEHGYPRGLKNSCACRRHPRHGENRGRFTRLL